MPENRGRDQRMLEVRYLPPQCEYDDSGSRLTRSALFAGSAACSGTRANPDKNGRPSDSTGFVGTYTTLTAVVPKKLPYLSRSRNLRARRSPDACGGLATADGSRYVGKASG